jgi:hypothetical protein
VRSQDPDAAREIRRAEGQLYLQQARRNLGRAAGLATTGRETLRGASRLSAPQNPAPMQPAPQAPTPVYLLGALLTPLVSMIRRVYRALPSFL